MRVGALGSFKAWVAGGSVNFVNLPMMGDLLTEWASGDTQSQHNETDGRTVQSSNGVVSSAYSSAQTARGFALMAIKALQQYVTPAPNARSASCISPWDSPSCRCRKSSATACRSDRW